MRSTWQLDPRYMYLIEKGEPNVFMNSYFQLCEWNTGIQEERCCNEKETVRKIACLGDRVSDSGGCQLFLTSMWVN